MHVVTKFFSQLQSPCEREKDDVGIYAIHQPINPPNYGYKTDKSEHVAYFSCGFRKHGEINFLFHFPFPFFHFLLFRFPHAHVYLCFDCFQRLLTDMS